MLFYHEWIVLYVQWFRWNYYDYFEIRLTIVDMIEPVHIQIESVNQFRMIEVFGNSDKNWNCKIFNHLINITSISLYSYFMFHNVSQDQLVVINGGYLNSMKSQFSRSIWNRNNHCNVECFWYSIWIGI